jgi:hypothetical protein
VAAAACARPAAVNGRTGCAARGRTCHETYGGGDRDGCDGAEKYRLHDGPRLGARGLEMPPRMVCVCVQGGGRGGGACVCRSVRVRDVAPIAARTAMTPERAGRQSSAFACRIDMRREDVCAPVETPRSTPPTAARVEPANMMARYTRPRTHIHAHTASSTNEGTRYTHRHTQTQTHTNTHRHTLTHTCDGRAVELWPLRVQLDRRVQHHRHLARRHPTTSPPSPPSTQGPLGARVPRTHPRGNTGG